MKKLINFKNIFTFSVTMSALMNILFLITLLDEPVSRPIYEESRREVEYLSRMYKITDMAYKESVKFHKDYLYEVMGIVPAGSHASRITDILDYLGEADKVLIEISEEYKDLGYKTQNQYWDEDGKCVEFNTTDNPDICR